MVDPSQSHDHVPRPIRRNPYPGPRPFRLGEPLVFAGRDDEAEELASLVIAHQSVLLYAQSGAGKTSLVNAGLSPLLKDKGAEVLPPARVGLPLPSSVGGAKAANVYVVSAIGDFLPDVEDTDPWLVGATISDALSRLARPTEYVGEPVMRVLVFDQFEELFSTNAQYWQHRRGFFEQIAEALRMDNYLRVLFVLREDYLARFMEFAPLLPESARTRYPLERLRAEQALAAINKPLEGTRWKFADGVPEELAADLTRINVERTSGEAESVPGEFVEPVQLQVVCYSLLERLPDEKTVITLEDLRAFGNPDEALQLFYEAAIDAALRSRHVDEEELRTWFDKRLITSSGTRGLVFQGPDGADGIPNEILAILEEQHLIRPEIRAGSRWYELTHDRFIGPIQRSNLSWWNSRRSESFEQTYDTSIKRALAESDVTEEGLRNFLDSTVAVDGSRLSRVADADLRTALQVLVDDRLLLRREHHQDVTYTPLNDTVAQAIQRSNQNWKARTFPEARNLRRLQSRASRWYRYKGRRKDELLLTRTELREAQKILRATEVASIRVSKALSELVKESQRVLRSRSRSLSLLIGISLAFVSLILVIGMFGPNLPFINKQFVSLIAPSIAGLDGAFLSLLVVDSESELILLDFKSILARLLLGLVVT